MASHWYALAAWDAIKAAEALRGVCVAYTPCETVERRKGNKPKVKLCRPVFVGYLFVFCEPEAFGTILGAGEVHDFVRYTTNAGVREPLRLHADALVPILLAEAFGALDYTKTPPVFKPERGDKVKIKSGKWSGFLARVLSVSKRKAIVETQWCKLEVEPEHLEAAA
jgi:transcription antitermination factor NusG